MRVFCAAASLSAQTLPVVSDAHVNSAYSATNFGSSVYLAVGGTSSAYIQFDLTALPAGLTAANVAKVNLVLFVNRIGTAGTIQVSQAAGAWTETGITSANAPGAGASIGTLATPASPTLFRSTSPAL